jgi:hypothetical protein
VPVLRYDQSRRLWLAPRREDHQKLRAIRGHIFDVKAAIHVIDRKQLARTFRLKPGMSWIAAAMIFPPVGNS